MLSEELIPFWDALIENDVQGLKDVLENTPRGVAKGWDKGDMTGKMVLRIVGPYDDYITVDLFVGDARWTYRTENDHVACWVDLGEDMLKFLDELSKQDPTRAGMKGMPQGGGQGGGQEGEGEGEDDDMNQLIALIMAALLAKMIQDGGEAKEFAERTLKEMAARNAKARGQDEEQAQQELMDRLAKIQKEAEEREKQQEPEPEQAKPGDGDAPVKEVPDEPVRNGTVSVNGIKLDRARLKAIRCIPDRRQRWDETTNYLRDTMKAEPPVELVDTLFSMLGSI